MLKLISSVILFFFILVPINAEEIKEIKVINNDRISKDTIQIFSGIKIGESYDQNDLNRILKDIYDTNFFSDVSLEIKDGVLTIDVKENKIIQNISVEGIKRQELIEDLKSRISSKDKNPFVENNIKNDVLLIKKLLKYAIPCGIVCVISVFVPILERFFVKEFIGDYELGLFAVAIKISLCIGVLAQAFQSAWGPFALKKYQEKDSEKIFNLILFLFATIISFLIILIIGFSKNIVSFLSSEK